VTTKELSQLIKQVQMLGKSPKLECFFWGEFLQPEKKKKEGAKATKGFFFVLVKKDPKSPYFKNWFQQVAKL
jgi:hypothetical protein